MKAEDLMIGDWVTITEPDDFHGYIANVVIINGETGYITVHIPNMHLHNVFVEDIQPIHITEEIFEKNGFDYDRNDGYAIFRLEDDSKLLYYFHEYKLTKFYKSEILFRCQCVYAHELQHALKLCKIEKEIIL